MKSSKSLLNGTFERSKGTTPLLNKEGFSGTQLVFHTLPSTLLYILISLVGIFIIICGIFVGTYVYKHCIRQPYSAENKKFDQMSNQQEGYNSLGLNVQEEENIRLRNQIYLEPVSDIKPQYEEIINRNETT